MRAEANQAEPAADFDTATPFFPPFVGTVAPT